MMLSRCPSSAFARVVGAAIGRKREKKDLMMAGSDEEKGDGTKASEGFGRDSAELRPRKPRSPSSTASQVVDTYMV